MIVKDTITVQKYLTINSSVTFETLQPYLNQAERISFSLIFNQTTTDSKLFFPLR